MNIDFFTIDGMTYKLRCKDCGFEWTDSDGSVPTCPICDANNNIRKQILLRNLNNRLVEQQIIIMRNEISRNIPVRIKEEKRKEKKTLDNLSDDEKNEFIDGLIMIVCGLLYLLVLSKLPESMSNLCLVGLVVLSYCINKVAG